MNNNHIITKKKPDPTSFMGGVWIMFCVVLGISVITILIETRSFLEQNGSKITDRYETVFDFYALFTDTMILAFIVTIHVFTSSLPSSPSSRCIFVIANIVAIKIAITYWTQTSNFVIFSFDFWVLDFVFYVLRLIGWFMIAIQVCSRFDLWKIENLPGTPNRGTTKPVYYRNSTLTGILLVILPVSLLSLDRFLLNTCLSYYVFISKRISAQEREYFHDLFARSWIAN